MINKLQFIFLLFLLLKSPVLWACDEVHMKYYSWAELKVDPPRPVNEILEPEVVLRESEGSSYYIATYCDNGVIQSLEKRLDKKLFFKFKYKYDDGKYMGTTLVKAVDQ